MAQDLLQYWNGNGFTDLGEVQQGFNISKTLDGSKDSAKFIILNYSDTIVEPYTILLHQKTNTYWVCSHDKKTRYMNDSGYLYIHEISCLGLIELLNARDLTDCGFRANKYTIFDFVIRLFKLSNFEWDISKITIDDHLSIDLYQKIDYVKTFENYTLLSALNELFNGYNCSLKARIQYYNGNWLFVLETIPKSGDLSLNKLDIDSFNNVGALANIDKNSYGAMAITNAENVISSKTIRYPVTGVSKVKSLSHETNETNACLILPSNVYKAIKLVLVGSPYFVAIENTTDSIAQSKRFYGTAYDEARFNSQLATFLVQVASDQGQAVADYINEHKQELMILTQKATSFELYDGFLYDAINNKFKMPKNAPSGMKLTTFRNRFDQYERNIVFTDKITRDSLQNTFQGIYWERGSNQIKGFDYFHTITDLGEVVSDRNVSSSYSILGTGEVMTFTLNNKNYKITISYELQQRYYFDYRNLYCYIEYVPMTALKIVSNNGLKKKDIQIYNQTGKLCDANALTKLINSYSKEITSNEVTRNSTYYKLSDLPSVGQIVNNNGVDYIINNISYDFAQNENDYYIETEITMSKKVAVKSLMVNADSNIRDYGIPQNFNVKRKEVYGNAYQCVYSQTYADTQLSIQNAELPKALNMYQDSVLMYSFPFETTDQFGYVAFIKCNANFPVYDNNHDTYVGTTNSYYYKLDCVKYILKNQLLVNVDFQDNNIIGIDNQNIASNFKVLIFFQEEKVINVPVSYVDENGELTGINIQFVRGDKVGQIFTDYATQESQNAYNQFFGAVFLDTDGDLYGYAQNYADFQIVANDYNKDAIEVPVFEVSYQLIGSEDIVVGENIFDSHEGEDIVVMYGFVQTDNEINELNYKSFIDDDNLSYDGTNLTLINACRIFYFPATSRFNINSYSYISYTIDNGNYLTGNQITFTKDKNVMVYRLFIDKSTQEIIDTDLMFICKKVPQNNISNDGYIYFETNIYKVK